MLVIFFVMVVLIFCFFGVTWQGETIQEASHYLLKSLESLITGYTGGEWIGGLNVLRTFELTKFWIWGHGH